MPMEVILAFFSCGCCGGRAQVVVGAPWGEDTSLSSLVMAAPVVVPMDKTQEEASERAVEETMHGEPSSWPTSMVRDPTHELVLMAMDPRFMGALGSPAS